MCLGGKIGGMKDDVAICMQLVTYWTGIDLICPWNPKKN